MAEKVSAIPDDLINWSGWAQGLNTDLRGAAKQLNQAIQDLNQSHPDPGILGPVAFAGNAAIGYAARNDSTDVWVGRVGQAFRSAATRGLPGGLIRANYDDFGRGLVTTDQSTISSQVGADPAAEAEKIRRAVELAEQVDEALAAGDADKARSLLNQLALDENWLDPTFDSAFFKELGPDGVRDVMPVIKDDEGLLVIFDNSLATATKAPDWDPAFNESLFPGPGPNWSPANHDLALLLKYGVYSEDFLTRAGDNILLGGTYDRNRPSDPWEEQLALEALSRNPDAALHYLLGHAFNPELKGPAFGPRVGELMVLYRQLFDTNPDLARAMGDLIGASAHASDARTVIVGPYGDEPQIQVL
ncbi:MAG TPA: hypothetical protein VOB72_01150, partial [Candidatus Dormibacteraeota bacterium]|nr:hypothetical protein [Candidatus Dormibacteraeota bacterium]